MLFSVSALNQSAGGMWDDSFASMASEGSTSISQFCGVHASKEAPMENSMSLQDLPTLVSETGDSDYSFNNSTKKDEPEEDPTRQVAKQMGYALMLQGGMHFALNPMMTLGKRLFRSKGNEEDVVEDAAAAHGILNCTEIQHGMLNCWGDMSSLAQAGAHESSRNMTGAFVLQKDVT